jgi:hypothetical protein
MADLDSMLKTPDKLLQLDQIIKGATVVGIWDWSKTFYAMVYGRTPQWVPGQLVQGPKKGMTGEVRATARLAKRRAVAEDKKKKATSGAMKASWKLTQMPDGFNLSSALPYASVLERGTYRGTGPRTIATDGGIFSTQAPGGMVKPILDDKQKLKGIVDAICAEIRRALESGGALAQ